MVQQALLFLLESYLMKESVLLRMACIHRFISCFCLLFNIVDHYPRLQKGLSTYKGEDPSVTDYLQI